jgi:hypothetical protein
MVIVQEEQGIYSMIYSRKFDPMNPEISYKDNTFMVDINTPSYSRGLKFYYFVDTTHGQITFYQDVDSNINSKVADMVLYGKIISQLTQNLSGDAIKLNIITLVIGAIIGGLTGYIIALGVMGG